MEVSPLEDLVLSGSHWRSFWSQSGSDFSAVWTHPELLPQVALINHANISLTLLCLPWQNPVLPAPQSLGFTGWLNELLRGSFYCLLLLLNCRPVTTVQLWSPWSPNQVVRGLCLSSHYTEGPSPETSRAVSGLQVSSSAGYWQWLWFFVSTKHHAKMDSSSHKGRLYPWALQNLFLG